MSRIGDKIKTLRTEAGMSQKVLAKKLGVAEGYINELETGKKVANEALIDRISKFFNKDINDISMSVEIESMDEIFEKKAPQPVAKKTTATAAPSNAAINDMWSGAFASVLKSVPICDYSLTKILGTKLMPIQDNKIEGHGQDKVFYIQISDDDMMGFRIAKGDIAFAHNISEVENNAICLVELNGERIIRQIKKLDSSKVLLVSNKGSVRTETAGIKEIKVIAKLTRVEFNL